MSSFFIKKKFISAAPNKGDLKRKVRLHLVEDTEKYFVFIFLDFVMLFDAFGLKYNFTSLLFFCIRVMQMMAKADQKNSVSEWMKKSRVTQKMKGNWCNAL